jgi:hypothetical protein
MRRLRHKDEISGRLLQVWVSGQGSGRICLQYCWSSASLRLANFQADIRIRLREGCRVEQSLDWLNFQADKRMNFCGKLYDRLRIQAAMRPLEFCRYSQAMIKDEDDDNLRLYE